MTVFWDDPFNRTVSPGSSDAPTGGTYTWSNTSGISVDGARLVIAVTTSRLGRLLSVSEQDVDILALFEMPATLSPGVFGIICRDVSGIDFYRIGLDPQSGSSSLEIHRFDAGSGVSIDNGQAGPTLVGGDLVWVRVQAEGINSTALRVKAWKDGDPEPGSWGDEVFDSTPLLQTAGAVGLRFNLGTQPGYVREVLGQTIEAEPPQSVPRLNARWDNFWHRGQMWDSFWQDNVAANYVDGALAVTGTGALGPTGQRVVQDVPNLSGVGTFASAATMIFGGALAVTGTDTFTQAGQRVAVGAWSVTGQGTLGSTASVLIPGAWAQTGAATFGAAGQVTQSGALAVTGTGALSGAASVLQSGALAITGTGALAGSGSVLQSGRFILGGYRAHVLADNPVSYWRLGESSGTLADDAVGANDGTYVNTPTLGVAGLLSGGDTDTAASFSNSQSEYVDVPDHASLDLGDSFTLEAIIKPSSNGVSGVKGIVSKGKDGYYMRLNAGRLQLVKSQTVDVAIASVGTALTADQTAHVLIAKDGSDVRLYVNGVDTSASVVNATIVDNALPLSIGADHSVFSVRSEYFDGVIDEVAVYDYALAPAPILEHANARSGGGGVGTITFSGTTAKTHDGAIDLQSFATLGLQGSVLQSGALAITGTGTLGAAGSVVQSGTLGLSGTGSATFASSVLFAGAASVTGTGSLAAAASVLQSGQASWAGTGALAGTGSVRFDGALAVAGTGNLAGAPSVLISLAWSQTGVGTLTGAASLLQSGALSINGAGTAAFSASILMSGALDLAGVGTFAGAASLLQSGALDATGTGTLAGLPTATWAGSWAVTGTGAHEGDPGTGGGVKDGTLALDGAAVLAGAGQRVPQGAWSVSGAATVDQAGVLLQSGTLAAAGTGTLVSAASVLVSAAQDSTGTGSFSGSSSATIDGALATSSLAVFAVGGQRLVVGALPVDAVGSWTAAGSVLAGGSALLITGAGQFDAAGTAVFAASWSVAAAGFLEGAGADILPKPGTVGAAVGLKYVVGSQAAPQGPFGVVDDPIENVGGTAEPRDAVGASHE